MKIKDFICGKIQGYGNLTRSLLGDLDDHAFRGVNLSGMTSLSLMTTRMTQTRFQRDDDVKSKI